MTRKKHQRTKIKQNQTILENKILFFERRMKNKPLFGNILNTIEHKIYRAWKISLLGKLLRKPRDNNQVWTCYIFQEKSF